jgi:hypothetical protein
LRNKNQKAMRVTVQMLKYLPKDIVENNTATKK